MESEPDANLKFVGNLHPVLDGSPVLQGEVRPLARHLVD
jgi:hypothetical protein